MDVKFNLFLLAAGLGTRLRPLTLKIPKPSLPLLNVPMGYYNLRYIKSKEVKKFIVNTYHLPDKIKSTYNHLNLFQEPVQYSDEVGNILGGGGALKLAESKLDLNLPIVLCNADEVFLAKDYDFISKAVTHHLEQKNLATIVVTHHAEAGHKFGAVWTKNKKIARFGKIKDLQNFSYKDYFPYHAIGVSILSGELLKNIPLQVEKNIFYDVLNPHLPDNTCSVYEAEMDWFETGNGPDYLETQFHLLKNLGTDLLGFINQFDPSYVYKTDASLNLISAKWLTLLADQNKLNTRDPKTVLAAANVQLQGYNIISKTSQPLTNLTLNNSVVFDDFILNQNYFK